MMSSYLQLSFWFELLIHLNLILNVIFTISAPLLEIPLWHYFMVLHLKFLWSFRHSLIFIVVGISRSPIKLSSYLQLPIMLNNTIFLSLGISMIISLIGTSALKISLRHNLILRKFDLLPSIRTIFAIVLSYITRLTLKLVVTNFELPLRFKFLDLLHRLVDVLAIVGAKLLYFPIRHDFVFRKCNFFLLSQWSLFIVVLNIVRFTRKLPSHL